MNGARGYRGRPLVALVIMMGAWIGLRVANWEAPPGFAQGDAFAREADPTALAVGPGAGRAGAYAAGRLFGPQSFPGAAYGIAVAGPTVAFVPGPVRERRVIVREIVVRDAWSRFAADPAREWPGLVAGTAAPPPGGPGAPPFPEAAPIRPMRAGLARTGPDRWSIDAWMLWRRGSDTALASGIYPATYGASQAGGILRYRLAPDDPHRPAAYLRTTSTLAGLAETSAALGLAARPFPAVPVVAALEARVTEQAGSRRVQPVAMAVTELAPFALPSGFRAEFYGQGGYVGGKYATPFADGQLRVDRSFMTIGPAEARLGAGAWAGAQKGASRLDIGPGATLGMPIRGTGSAKVGLDWRIRVGGNAAPASGPALTVSAGF
ncbi:hypothetical protein [Novosphingobium album (ex Liu et al. 2023)]|uniref:Bacterial surface antigen (D15) domain-containing protein n=1 Tax=Novosphingobium album (ex Liu et al. 2023) TaxID=3031130 RepID=A0ABT5WRG7_9SPHN|nr:hypothetical protein [Novosphingobium album (ex Liu et al. 2023)]MDE8652643.1 hypothetical protein [Novosphingobium album (ex Liu et al. 2023)]